MDGYTLHSALIKGMSFASEICRKVTTVMEISEILTRRAFMESRLMFMPERDASDGRCKNTAQCLSGDRTFMWQLSVASGTLCPAAWLTHHPVAALIS